MKKIICKCLNILIQLMILFLMPDWVHAKDDELISINFYQTDDNIILESLADLKNINLIIEDELETKHTIKLNQISWDQALILLAKTMKLDFELSHNILFVRKQKSPLSTFELAQIEQKQQELMQDLILSTIKVNHADIKSIMLTINEQKMLSERGKIWIDERSNSVIVNDIRQRVQAINQLAHTLDFAIEQVHIQAHIVTMSEESFSELGIKWGYQGASSQLIDKFNIGLGVSSPTTTVGFNVAKRSGSLLNLELSALESENQVEIIASPNLLTSHLKTASIKQGSEIPYEVSSGSNGATSIEFKQAVLGLEVTPRVLKNGQLELNLQISQNTAGRSIKRSDGGEALAIDTQEIKTQVIVNDGETLILGGIFQQNKVKDEKAVPGLSKLPLVGGLFKYDGLQSQKRELIIFITPTLIKTQ